MAIQAKLFVDGEYYPLKEFEYGFINGDNANGFSSGKTRQKGLTCVIEAIRQEHFEEWAMENYMKKYVEVHIAQGVGGMGRTRILKCHDTFLLELHTHFSSTSGEPMTFKLYMKSGAIEASWSTAAHVEPWSELPTNEGEVTVLEEDLEPQFLNRYVTDSSGNKQSSYKLGDDIFFVIETKNMIGKIISVDLSDKKADFLYQGKRLKNDFLENYTISDDIERIPLQVIPDEHNELD